MTKKTINRNIIVLCLSFIIIVLIIGFYRFNYNNSYSNIEINREVYKSTETFIESIKKGDLDLFLSQVNNNGIILIRNFVTGGNGTRGTDLRMFIKPNRILNDISINVINGEEGFILKYMFAQSIKKDINEYNYYIAKEYSFQFKDNGKIHGIPSTSEVVDKCLEIRALKYKNIYKPTIIVLSNNELILTESSVYMDLPIGTWAIFKKEGKKYLLTALFDFR